MPDEINPSIKGAFDTCNLFRNAPITSSHDPQPREYR